MSDAKTIIRQALEQTGLGPSRLDDIDGGAQIFGPTGVVNSMEFVQFLSVLSEDLRVDVFELLGDVDIVTSSIFSNIDALSGFVAARTAAVTMQAGE
ncbi:hypothetical protein [uncultured Roseobacter sp.]|uniref:hypothetical protein n=1 Tax=uncultured Roseobacter sp. TaxID=114847 RepID=UPI002625C4DE|nr:hypothetical protein [uncultured Roseobacter sp.]